MLARTSDLSDLQHEQVSGPREAQAGADNWLGCLPVCLTGKAALHTTCHSTGWDRSMLCRASSNNVLLMSFRSRKLWCMIDGV